MAPDFRLLALNPGSTTSKIAVFAGDKLLLEEKIEHKAEDLRVFEKATDQYEYRLKMIRDALAAAKIDLNTLDAVVGRGGLLKPLPGGTFRVNKQMVDDLLYRPAVDHASNLGAVIAYHLSQKLGIPAFIVDPVVVDEYDEVARISGYPGIQRQSRSHALNMKAVAHKVARDRGRAYRDLRLVVAHLGSGFSISVHVGGRMIDTTNPNDEGPFSIERGGDLPVTLLLPLIYEKFRAGWSLERLQALFIRESGLYAYMGTKAGIDHVIRCVANEFGEKGIRANSISPGLTQSPMTEQAMESPSLVETFRKCYPLGRIGTSEDIAAAAVFLASDECFMTGENLQVNGGLCLRRNPRGHELYEAAVAAGEISG